MYSSLLIPIVLAPLAAALSDVSPQYVFTNPPSSHESAHLRIPTVHESAVQARRILRLENIGTLSTVFPHDNETPSPFENRPQGLGGTAIGLMDYFGDCEPDTGNPTMLAISIATSFKNVAAGSNISTSLQWHPPDMHEHRYSAADLPRFALTGYLEDMMPWEVVRTDVPNCFVDKHPDAVTWLPGNRIHQSKWVRLVVQEIYWIGGFGDRAYIGWIPAEVWRNVTMKEISECRLPGEKGTARNEWAGERSASWMEWLRGDL